MGPNIHKQILPVSQAMPLVGWNLSASLFKTPAQLLILATATLEKHLTAKQQQAKREFL